MFNNVNEQAEEVFDSKYASMPNDPRCVYIFRISNIFETVIVLSHKHSIVYFPLLSIS